MQKGSPFLYWLKVVSLGIVLGLGLQFAQAWTAPTQAPPLGNVGGPVTLGAGAQYKTGKLGVNSATTPINALEVGGGGNVLIGGILGVAGNIFTQTGSISTTSGNIWTASGNITSNTGNIVANTGNIQSTAGNIIARGGSIAVQLGDAPTQSIDTNGKIRMRSQTAAGDAADIVATKGYVDGKVGGGSGTVTMIATGSGLTGGPITTTGVISVQTSYVQRRVASTCSVGSSIRVINEDGTVVCEMSGSGGAGVSGSVVAGCGYTNNAAGLDCWGGAVGGGNWGGSCPANSTRRTMDAFVSRAFLCVKN